MTNCLGPCLKHCNKNLYFIMIGLLLGIFISRHFDRQVK